jgi:bud site selection protein 31
MCEFRLFLISLEITEVNEPHEGLRKNESQWPVFQINWQKTRYIYDMYYTFRRISKEIYEYCINNKIVDASLIAKWKKTGYERLCSTYVINPHNYKFGTVSICRVPSQHLPPGTNIEDPTTGCRGCASGSRDNIFGNKYGQYLAAIQVAREERRGQLMAAQAAAAATTDDNSADDEDDCSDNEEKEDSEEESDVDAPVETADGRSKPKVNIWARNATENSLELSKEMVGQHDAEAQREAMAAMSKSGIGSSGGGGGSYNSSGKAASSNIPGKRVQADGPPGKRTRPN